MPDEKYDQITNIVKNYYLPQSIHTFGQGGSEAHWRKACKWLSASEVRPS